MTQVSRSRAFRSDSVWRSAALLAILLTGCGEPATDQETRVGDVAAGRTVVATLDCGVCHDIPGIAGADWIVGPPLAGFGRRTLIAGLLPNEPDLLAQWVRDAPSLVPNTGMPDLPISDAEAANVAAFLYTLR